jgi:hypothetical protein
MLGGLVQEWCESGYTRRLDTARKALRDLLQQPLVAVGITEGRIRPVGAPLRIGPCAAALGGGVPAAAQPTAGVVEDVADVDAAGTELVVCRVDRLGQSAAGGGRGRAGRPTEPVRPAPGRLAPAVSAAPRAAPR